MYLGITRWKRCSRCKRDVSGDQGEPLWEESRGGHGLEQPERLHRKVSTCDGGVRDFPTRVYFQFVSVLGSFTCFQKTLFPVRTSMQTACIDPP